MSDQILRELGEIKGMLVTHIATTELKLEKHDEKIQEHSWELWGKNGNPGLCKEVDRAKTAISTGKWVVACITGLFSWVNWDQFIKLFKH
jgi:hypothetical protein